MEMKFLSSIFLLVVISRAGFVSTQFIEERWGEIPPAGEDNSSFSIIRNFQNFHEEILLLRNKIWNFQFESPAILIQRKDPRIILPLAVPLVLLLGLMLASYGAMNITRTAIMLRKFPNAPKRPIFGSVTLLPKSKDFLAVWLHLGIKEYSRRFVIWIGHNPWLFIMEANTAQLILSSNKYIEKGKDYENFRWLMGNGLITSNGSIWRDDRKLLSPSFKYQKYDGFLETFNRHSKTLVKILNDRRKLNEPINLHPLLSAATMDFIAEAALGQTTNFQYDLDSRFFKAIHMALNSFRTRLARPWLNFPIIWEIFGHGRDDRFCLSFFRTFVNEVIRNRKIKLLEIEENQNQVPTAEESTTKPFIDALLNTRTDEDILAHVLTIFGAGFETTASGMNFTLFLLALNPLAQIKVHEEIDEVFNGDKENVSFEDLSELKYLEMCIKESLRLFPPAPMMIRHAFEDIQLEKDIMIPKGVQVMFWLYDLHRDPEHFPDPETFDPERFLPSESAARHPYAFIPFSGGPRNCLGMKYAMIQMKTCLAYILRHFHVSTTQTREELKIIPGMILETFPSPLISLKVRR